MSFKHAMKVTAAAWLVGIPATLGWLFYLLVWPTVYELGWLLLTLFIGGTIIRLIIGSIREGIRILRYSDEV